MKGNVRNMHLSSRSKVFAFLGVFAVASLIVMPAFADQVIQPTSGGTIDIGFVTDPSTPIPGGQSNLHISFINKSTHQNQPHIDYKITIMEGNNQVGGTGEILHTAEGSITYPFQFPDPAKYQVIVEVDGILFQPIPPETSTFTVDLSGGGSGSITSNSTSTSTPSSNSTAQANSTQKIVIPIWVKNNAKWWSQGQIDDSQFIQGIQYLIKQGIIQIPSTQGGASTGAQQIPAWIKNNAGWWADGQISDTQFVQGIQWLITNGIIVV